MDTILDKITEWLKELIIEGIMDHLTDIFETVNDRVDWAVDKVGSSPSDFSPDIFTLIQNISETVILPIAGIILTFIACWELIQMVIDHNNLANFETWTFFRWIFKTAVAILLISNTFTITMAIFDVAQNVIAQSGSLISTGTAIDESALDTLRDTLEDKELGALISIWMQTFIIRIALIALSIAIYVIVYGRMIEIYLMVSLSPIPFATFGNKEQSQIGQNFLRSLFALAFQGFLMMICLAIYAILVQNIAFTDQIVASIWGIVGFTVLLCFSLFKTGSISKSIFSAH